MSVMPCPTLLGTANKPVRWARPARLRSCGSVGSGRPATPLRPHARCNLCGGLDCQQPEAALGHTQAVIRGGCHTLHAPGRVSGRVGVVGRRLAAAWLAIEGAECRRDDWRCRLVRAERDPQSWQLRVPCRLLEDVWLEGMVARSWHALQQRQLGSTAWVHLQPMEDMSMQESNRGLLTTT